MNFRDKTKSAKQVDTEERRNLTMELRKAGLTYRQIAKQVIDKFGLDMLPKGYDYVYAFNDVKRVLQKVREETYDNAQDIIDTEIQRLDTMLAVVWQKITSRDTNENVRVMLMDRAIKIMERRTKFLGLDKPSELNVRQTITLEDIEDLIDNDKDEKTDVSDKNIDSN